MASNPETTSQDPESPPTSKVLPIQIMATRVPTRADYRELILLNLAFTFAFVFLPLGAVVSLFGFPIFGPGMPETRWVYGINALLEFYSAVMFWTVFPLPLVNPLVFALPTLLLSRRMIDRAYASKTSPASTVPIYRRIVFPTALVGAASGTLLWLGLVVLLVTIFGGS